MTSSYIWIKIRAIVHMVRVACASGPVLGPTCGEQSNCLITVHISESSCKIFSDMLDGTTVNDGLVSRSFMVPQTDMIAFSAWRSKGHG